MLRIGLTGGIGSGKTTVSKIFELLGIPVYNADDAAKRIMNTNEKMKAAIKKKFGEEAYKNEEININYLAPKVFNNEYQLELLNALVHPATIQDAEQWMMKQTTPYVVKEAALLFESAAAGHLDYIIGVYAPEKIRITRTMERNNVSAEEVLKRMKRQIDEEIKMKLCDFVLKNDEQQLLIPQVYALHEQLLKLSFEKQKQL
jgi:dephospho-CoA kinase